MHVLKSSSALFSALCLSLVFAGCAPASSSDPDADAGVSEGEPDDGGEVNPPLDAGLLLVEDAGETLPDAGEVIEDAGVDPVFDAGAAPFDAGISTPDAGESIPDAGPTAPTCVRTLCITGAQNRSTWGNFPFQDMCDYPGIQETLIEDCLGNDCYSVWETFYFQRSVENDLLPAVRDALDTNSDGTVDEDDEACDLHLTGYSWGGVNAVKLAQAIELSDEFVGDRKTVAKVVSFDPYQIATDSIQVPANVERFWTFRHSTPPTGEVYNCSAGAPLGPYYGVDPACTLESECVDYDFSTDSSYYSWDAYTEHSADGRPGDKLGHCSVLEASIPGGYAVLLGEPLPSLPTPSPVATY